MDGGRGASTNRLGQEMLLVPYVHALEEAIIVDGSAKFWLPRFRPVYRCKAASDVASEVPSRVSVDALTSPHP